MPSYISKFKTRKAFYTEIKNLANRFCEQAAYKTKPALQETSVTLIVNIIKECEDKDIEIMPALFERLNTIDSQEQK